VAGELPPVFADQLAYVMSTSGSTGEPKDIAIIHRGVVELATDPSWDMRPHDRVLFHSPHAFDASTWEIWGPLLVGGRVVVAPSETSAAAALRELITGHGVNRLLLTAGLLRVVADGAETGPEDLSRLFADRLPAYLVRAPMLYDNPTVALLDRRVARRAGSGGRSW
jgi:non-ribosomal peptide synthetase component F